MERLYQKKKILAVAALVGVLLIAAVSAAILHYRRVTAQATPLLWPSADVYIEGQTNAINEASAYFMAQLLAVNPEDITQAFTTCQNSGSSRCGAWKSGNQVVYFSFDPASGALSSHSNQDLPKFSLADSFTYAWKRYQLAKLQENAPMIVALNQPSAQLLGSIRENQGMIALRLSQKPSLLRYPLQTTELPGGSLYFQSHKAFDTNAMPAPFAKLPPNWLASPSKLHISRGNVQRMLKNPYDGGLSWSLESSMSLPEANTLLLGMVDQLSHIYPLLQDRLLPDRTTVSELEINQQQFLLPDQVLDLSKQPTGTLTHPQGQLTYSYENGVFAIEQNRTSDEFAVSDSMTCLVPEADAYGYADGSSADELPWRQIQFSLSQDQVSICILPE